MMTKLIDKVTNLVDEEYELASATYGKRHNSSHEAVAVICEEIDEANEENCTVRKVVADFWQGVKVNSTKDEQNKILDNLKSSAILCACEMIQVAAMAHKAMQGYAIDDYVLPIRKTEKESESE